MKFYWVRNFVSLLLAGLAAMSIVACSAITPTPIAAVSLFPDTQPGSGWQRVVAPGWSDQAGFSLMLPPGWELNELQGVDSYVGEGTV